MSEESQVQSDSVMEETGGEAGGVRGGSKAIIGVVIVLIIAAVAVVVFARQGGNNDQGAGTGEENGVVERFGDAAALEGDEVDGGEAAAAAEAPGATVIEGGFAVDAPEGQAKEFDVTGKNFEFSMKEIRVKKGDTVRVNFTSAGGTHNWMAHEFDATTETVNEGGTSAVVFVADKAGEFEYHCMVGSHSQLGMVGKLIVEE